MFLTIVGIFGGYFCLSCQDYNLFVMSLIHPPLEEMVVMFGRNGSTFQNSSYMLLLAKWRFVNYTWSTSLLNFDVCLLRVDFLFTWAYVEDDYSDVVLRRFLIMYKLYVGVPGEWTYYNCEGCSSYCHLSYQYVDVVLLVISGECEGDSHLYETSSARKPLA